jgi:hypothetical protein
MTSRDLLTVPGTGASRSCACVPSWHESSKPAGLLGQARPVAPHLPHWQQIVVSEHDQLGTGRTRDNGAVRATAILQTFVQDDPVARVLT